MTKATISIGKKLKAAAQDYAAFQELNLSEYITKLIKQDLVANDAMPESGPMWRERMRQAMQHHLATGEPLEKAIEFYSQAQDPAGDIAAGFPDPAETVAEGPPKSGKMAYAVPAGDKTQMRRAPQPGQKRVRGRKDAAQAEHS